MRHEDRLSLGLIILLCLVLIGLMVYYARDVIIAVGVLAVVILVAYLVGWAAQKVHELLRRVR